MIDEQREKNTRENQEFDSESIVIMVVGSLEFDEHQINCSERSRQKDDFHRRIINGYEGGNEIQVAGSVDDSEQDLRSSRNTCARSRFPYFQKKDDDGEKMGKIAQ